MNNESETTMTTIKLTATDRALGKTESDIANERRAMIERLIAADPNTLTAGQKALRTRLAAEIGVTLVAPKAPALSPTDAARQAWVTRRDNAESALRLRAHNLALESAAFREFLNHREHMKTLMRANPEFSEFLTVFVDSTVFNLERANETLADVVAQIDAPVTDAPAVELHAAQIDATESAPRRNRRAA